MTFHSRNQHFAKQALKTIIIISYFSIYIFDLAINWHISRFLLLNVAVSEKFILFAVVTKKLNYFIL